MSKSSGQKDPSMDEILGSIRRIITEDNAQSGQPVEAPEDPPVAAEEDDVLELTDMLGVVDEPESRREPILTPVEPTVQDDVIDPLEERREPVLGIHSPAAAPEPVFEEPVAEMPMEPTMAVDAPAAAPEPVFEEPVADMPVEQTMAVAPPAEGQTPPQEEVFDMATSDESGAPPVDLPEVGGEDLVSSTTSTSTAEALGELSRAMDERVSRQRLGEGDATLSDIVKELVRPMLRDWIDQNLPMIVERVVRREIQKLVDRTPDDD
jgi:cell pole-organizing protein PopZ